MAAFLAEHVGSRTLYLLGALGIALAASTIECERPAPPSPAPRLERVTCKQPATPRRIYISIDPASEYRDRVETVALLTVAEHPEWELRLATPETPREPLPGYMLSISARITSTSDLTVQCTASATTTRGHRSVGMHAPASVDYGDGAREAATNACVTTAVEDAVEQILTTLR